VRRVTAQPIIDPQASMLLGIASAVVGVPDLAKSLSTTALSGLRSQGRLRSLVSALEVQGWSAVYMADANVAVPALDEAARLALGTGRPRMYHMAVASQAMLTALRGERERARDLAAQAEEMSLPDALRPVMATVETTRGLAALGDGVPAKRSDIWRARTTPPTRPSIQHSAATTWGRSPMPPREVATSPRPGSCSWRWRRWRARRPRPRCMPGCAWPKRC
jgi:hypothetical protein